MNKIPVVRVLAIAFGGVAVMIADTESGMTTDRPDFTESTDTVRPGAIQLERGLAVSQHALATRPPQEIGARFSLIRIDLNRFPNYAWTPTVFSANPG